MLFSAFCVEARSSFLSIFAVSNARCARALYECFLRFSKPSKTNSVRKHSKKSEYLVTRCFCFGEAIRGVAL